jgi:hypothetical protein
MAAVAAQQCERPARRAREKSPTKVGLFFARPGRRYQAKRDAPTRCSSFQRRGEADARTTGDGGGALARDVGVGNKESTSTVTARACNRVRREGLDIRTTPFWWWNVRCVDLAFIASCGGRGIGVCNGYATGVESIHPQPDEGSHDP